MLTTTGRFSIPLLITRLSGNGMTTILLPLFRRYPNARPKDRFVEVSELATLIGKCQEEKDFELQGFIILAACTGLRKTAILSRKWDELKLDVEFPSIFLPKKGQ
jgi:integrase